MWIHHAQHIAKLLALHLPETRVARVDAETVVIIVDAFHIATLTAGQVKFVAPAAPPKFVIGPVVVVVVTIPVSITPVVAVVVSITVIAVTISALVVARLAIIPPLIVLRSSITVGCSGRWGILVAVAGLSRSQASDEQAGRKKGNFGCVVHGRFVVYHSNLPIGFTENKKV